MQRSEVSGAVRPVYGSLGVKRLIKYFSRWGTLLVAQLFGSSRVRFSVVSLEFFIDIILPAALWPWC